MSGHSKWSTIKRKKGAIDSKRGKIFTKLIKEITLAARLGGGDLEGNSRLRQAVLAAKEENMPKDNIDRAIKKGTGELAGAAAYEEVIDVMTDNKNRTVAEIRHIFSKHGGNLGENGCVAWMFDKKGSIVFDKTAVGEDALMEIALEAGAEDVRDQETEWEVITDPVSFEAVKRVIGQKGWKYLEARVGKIPRNTIKLEAGKAEQMLRLMEKL